MIVCICTGASERDIRRAMDGGAATLAELSDSGRAGKVCGQCRSVLLEMLGRESCDDCPRRHSLGAAPDLGRCARN